MGLLITSVPSISSQSGCLWLAGVFVFAASTCQRGHMNAKPPMLFGMSIYLTFYGMSGVNGDSPSLLLCQ